MKDLLMFRFSAALFALSAIAGSPALAQSDDGLYVAGFIGAGFPSDATLSGTQTPEAGAPGTIGDPARIRAA